MIAPRIVFEMRRAAFGLAAAMLLGWGTMAEGVILLRTGDVAANTTAPTGELANSGWQYQGWFGDFLATAIAPHFIITAKHVGEASQFFYRGETYTVLRSFTDSASDLAIHEVSQTLPDYAQLYTRRDEVGRRLVVFGRGTQRGPERIVDGEFRGWNWGAADHLQRWGENTVASITSDGFLRALFDQGGLANEADLAAGDSGGAVFIRDGGTWKLAGINYDVDHFASGPNGDGLFEGAMFDQRGSYTPAGILMKGSAPLPSGFTATRISPRIDWITGIIAPRQEARRHE